MPISVPAGDYQVPLDIANASCDHLGATQITSFTQNSKVAARLSFRYDKVRKYELTRNLWVFSIRKAVLRPIDTTSMSVTFGAWDATKTYVLGSVVTYGGLIWQAVGAVPIAQQPDNSPTYWYEYFGPTVATPWTQQNYYAGELVYYPTSNPTSVYLSLANLDAQEPDVIAVWNSTTTYNKGQTVLCPDGDTVMQSETDLNLGNTPAEKWLVGTTYPSGALVLGSDDIVYLNIAGNSTGVNPTTDGGVHWQIDQANSPWMYIPATQVDTPEGTGWLKLGAAAAASLQIIYPLGSGPASETMTLNMFKLPNGFLREAPQDPKAGQLTWLGGPGNNVMKDWNYENGYITSNTFTPITFRFGADVKDVSKFDAMFCELFAARLALECVEVVTQAVDKKQAIGAEYKRWGDEARTRNGIEIGPVQADEDEYVSVRR